MTWAWTQTDSLAPSPVDWEDIPLGPGQQPNANGDSHSFQFTKEGDAIAHTDVRRNPDQTFRYIGHWPERP